MSIFPENLKYTKSNEWVKKEGELFLVGISDFAQEQLGDIVFVDFPELGDCKEQGETLGELESSKAVSEFFMPFGGEVVEVNEELADSPELLNSAPYESWLVKIRTDNDLYDTLMTCEEAEKAAEAE